MREAKSTTVDARKLRDQLAHLGVRPLGLVMNGTEPVALRDHYGYLGYAGRRQRRVAVGRGGHRLAALAAPESPQAPGRRQGLGGGPRRSATAGSGRSTSIRDRMSSAITSKIG